MQIISPKCQIFSWVLFRSSRPEVFFKRGVLENFVKFTGNSFYWSLFLIKLQSFRSQLFLKKRLQHKRFRINFAKFSRTSTGDCLISKYIDEQICWANTFLKLSKTTTWVFRVYLKISQILQEEVCVGISF